MGVGNNGFKATDAAILIVLLIVIVFVLLIVIERSHTGTRLFPADGLADCLDAGWLIRF